VSEPDNLADTARAWQSGDVSGPNEPQTITAVAIGGILGSAGRWAIGTRLTPDGIDEFPWHVLLVNVIGCLLIGVASARVARGSIAWAFVATGLLGGFTTMSGLAVSLNGLAESGETATMVTYLFVTLVAGFGALLAAERLSGSVADDDSEGIE